MKIIGISLLTMSIIYGIIQASKNTPAFGLDYWLMMVGIIVAVQLILN